MLTRAEQGVHEVRSSLPCGLPIDADLPGFATVLDTAAMTQIFGEQLLGGGQCRRVEFVRFRHRPAKRLIAVYEVDAETADGHAARLIVTARLGRERKSSASSTVYDHEPCPRRAHVRDNGLWLDVFPEDVHLPALRRYASADGAGLRDLIARAAPGGEIALQPVRYRPGLSASFAVHRDRPDGRSTLGFVKITRGDVPLEDTSPLDRINSAFEKGGAAVRLARPAAVNEADRAAFYLPAPGVPLDRLLAADGAPFVAGGAAADALGALHGLDVSGLRLTFAADIAERIERARRNLVWACPGLVRAIDALALRAALLSESTVAAPTHRDMKPDHVFIDESRQSVELIDAGAVCLGNPLIDVAGLLVRTCLAVAEGVMPQQVGAAFCETFLQKYFSKAPAAWQGHYRSAHAYASLLVATHLLQKLAPAWRDEVERVIARSLELRGVEP